MAVYSYSGFDKCQNNIIFGNYAEEYGGGIYLYDNTYATFTNLTLTNNGAPSGSGVYCSDTGNLTLANSIIWDNPGTEIVHGQTDPRITYSNVKGGWPGPGNIGQDPEFVDRANDDFHLLYHSPCRNAGDNNAPQLPLDDFEDDPRIAEGVVDMGADEFHSHLYFTGDSTPGGSVELKFVGIPGTSPVGLWISAASLTDPINGKFGSWYLLPPMLFMGPIPPIPAPGGVESIPGAIPQNPPAPYSLYLQAFLGDKLSNLCLMEVE